MQLLDHKFHPFFPLNYERGVQVVASDKTEAMKKILFLGHHQMWLSSGRAHTCLRNMASVLVYQGARVIFARSIILTSLLEAAWRHSSLPSSTTSQMCSHLGHVTGSGSTLGMNSENLGRFTGVERRSICSFSVRNDCEQNAAIAGAINSHVVYLTSEKL